MLIARPLHAFVRAPINSKTQPVFCLPATGSAAERTQFSAEVPSRIPVTLIRRAARHYDKPRADSGVFKKAMRANG
jgi:hypothetical protein